jgi:hypothetical protein
MRHVARSHGDDPDDRVRCANEQSAVIIEPLGDAEHGRHPRAINAHGAAERLQLWLD